MLECSAEATVREAVAAVLVAGIGGYHRWSIVRMAGRGGQSKVERLRTTSRYIKDGARRTCITVSSRAQSDTMKAFVCSFLVVLLVAAVFAQEKAKETLKGAEAYYAYAAPYAYSAFGYPAVSAYSAYPYAAAGYPYYYR
ncbi:uncharacterized protein LOC126176897 [Schistocerca cancellata]|uniref:uncharacterized protein LOC126176897 n=1 Tax=Schistocerca cancellata TaxID=274614 RepID=UPI0021185306|nr:uncharacterized protein LOC126176897 [Schistocerca cancellata]